MSVVVWFRKCLRVHDNAALVRAVSLANSSQIGVIPVFFLDPRFLDKQKFASHRLVFLLESLQDLDVNLRKLNAHSRLVVIRGNPAECLPALFKEWNIEWLLFERDTSPFSKQRDALVTSLAHSAGVKVESFVGHTLFDMDELARQSGADKQPECIPQTMVAFTRLVSKMAPPPRPLPVPQGLPGLGFALSELQYALPLSIEELGFEPVLQQTPYRGGESVALKRLREYVTEQRPWVACFEKPKTDPSAFAAPGSKSTTVLSPYITHGCLSSRRFFWEVKDIEEERVKHSQPPGSLVGQLYFREMFYLAGHTVPNFDQIEGNPMCRQIKWEESRPDLLEAWTHAKTGYPWIDAIMTQLRKEGWIHHLARHAVACFLTRGDLYISWIDGARVFNYLLLDGDWSVNTANWQWLSCSCFFYQYFRVYSPISFPKQYDKSGSYVRHFLPVLAKMPDKYIYEPWKAPLRVQQAAGCIIGKDYPAPVVNHDEARKTNLARIRIAYATQKASNASHPQEDEAEELEDDNDDELLKSTKRQGTSKTVTRKKSKV